MKRPRITQRYPVSLFLAASFTLCVLLLPAEPSFHAALPFVGGFSVVERADLRKYENGRYVGVEFRETKGIFRGEPGPQSDHVEGTLYFLEGLTHQGSTVAHRIDAAIPVSYAVLLDGSWAVSGDPVYPMARGFPAIPARALSPGEAWRAPGVRVVAPLREGSPVSVRFDCSYRYDGVQELNGGRAGLVSAQYALRYDSALDPWGQGPVVSVRGSHALRIRLDPGSRAVSFIQDRLEEEYRLEDGRSIGYKGFALTWVLPAAPLDPQEAVRNVTEALSRSGASDVEVARKPEGVTLSVNRIHFVADQAAVLPEDLLRLASVAAALESVPKRSFRVIGHTAAVGSEESQRELSVQRAKAVVDYLVSRGLSAGRFLYEGRGGGEPVASNDTEEGRAANRRVEIVILED